MGMLVHNFIWNSFEFPVNDAISRGGTPAVVVISVTKVLVSASRVNRKDRIMPWAKQCAKLNRKKARVILLSVIRSYADFKETMISLRR